jgi:alkyl hydroperoxide reductase subunit AhpF
MQVDSYDVIIVGAGPGGLSCARAGRIGIACGWKTNRIVYATDPNVRCDDKYVQVDRTNNFVDFLLEKFA